MGRWDALKPDENRGLQDQELTECIGILYGKARSRNDASRLSVQDLMKLTSFHANELHAEDTVQQLVGPFFVPELQACPGNETTKISICGAIQRLLTFPRFASAMLAPLVQDVSNNGEEETMPNTVRRDLFRSLQNILFAQVPSYPLKSKACSTLATMVEASQNTDEGRNVMIMADLDQRKLDDFIIQNLDAGCPLYRPCLQLLKVLLSIRVTATHYSTLLFTSSPVQRQSNHSHARTARCRLCSCETTSSNPFLSSVHKSIFNRDSGIVLECTAKMVAALPLNLWFGQQTRVGGMQSLSGFHRQLVISLIHVFDIARCAMGQKGEWSHSLANLVTTLFDVIPWQGDRLIAAGQSLWSAIANAFVDKPSASMASVMVATLGGQVTPQGNLVPMPLPVRQWLTQQESGVAFTRALLSDIEAASGHSSLSSNILCAILRTSPESALLVWQDFQILLQGVDAKNRKRNDICINLLEAFLSGRRNFPIHDTGKQTEECKISELAFLVLDAATNDGGPKRTCRCLSCYGLMLPVDWNFLALDQPRLTELTDRMMRFCSSPNENIRRDACKALGEFSSAYLTMERLSASRDVTIPSNIANQVCLIMMEVLRNDKSAAVRSMAIFALGNVAVAIMDNFEIVTTDSAVEITHSLYETLKESNDKVVGNAIRSVGHWGNIIARMNKSPTESQPLSRCLVQVIDCLSHQVQRTLAVASIDKQIGMSWRERSAAKKHGWGACYSLGRVFAGIGRLPDSLVEQESLLHAVENLVGCLQRETSLLLPEKVVVAAMISLRAMKPCQLGAISGKNGLVGAAMVGCCVLLFCEGCNGKIQQDGNHLLGHLLSCAGISDATFVVKHEEITKAMLESLYGWMVEQGMEGRCFEIFALAFQRLVLSSKHDLSLEQRFASRALSQYKKAQMISLTSDDENYDEL